MTYIRPIIPVKERLLASCKPNGKTGCWDWVRYVYPDKHPTIGTGLKRLGNSKKVKAHRVSYEIFVGPIPDGLVVRHKCDNKLCVNPEHLEVGTQRDNLLDKIERGQHNYAHRTACKHGHPFTPENTRIRENGARRCLACQTLANAKFAMKSSGKKIPSRPWPKRKAA